MKTVLSLLALLAFFSALMMNDADAQVSTNNAFILEGSGFAVTEDIIQISEIDLAVSTQQNSGSSIKSLIEDGFITLGDTDFLATKLKATLLRDGKYVRINGIAENPQGDEASVRFFGRLVEQSKDASIYGFTGRITTETETYKVIYTAKFSELLETAQTPESSSNQIIIEIVKGSSSQSLLSNYMDTITEKSRLRYFSMDRISVEPETTVTFVNNDLVPHSIVSGTGLGTHSSIIAGDVKICTEVTTDVPAGFSILPEGSDARGCDFIYDGKINTGTIKPGESVSVTFEERGFYRLIDPDYPWMRIDGYVFGNINSLILGSGQNLGN